jgi:hypothetical protein
MNAKKLAGLVAIGLLAAVAPAHAESSGTVFGAAIGGGAGAAIGGSFGGRDGAILGSVIGAAAGAAIGSHSRPVVVHPQPVYGPPPRHVHAPVVVYPPPRVVHAPPVVFHPYPAPVHPGWRAAPVYGYPGVSGPGYYGYPVTVVGPPAVVYSHPGRGHWKNDHRRYGERRGRDDDHGRRHRH